MGHKFLTVGCCIPLLALVAPGAEVAWAQEASEEDSHDRTFGGPEDVSRNLEEQAKHEPVYEFHIFHGWTEPYRDWKDRLNEEYGLTFGLSAHLLYQNASEVMGDQDDAFGGVYRFQGSWHALGRGTGSPGRLDWRVENRSAGFGLLSPTALGNDLGAAAFNPGFAYSDGFDTDLAVLNWTQAFNDQRAAFAVGRLSFDVYQDAYAFQTFSRGFINRAFVVNPTIGTTGVGSLGAVMKGFVSEQVWLGGQIYDGNAKSGEFDFDTIEEGEWLTNVEIGWTPSIDRYKTDRIQFTYWEKDALSSAGTPSGQGWVMSASWQVGKRWLPFARLGDSDGGAGVPAETAASAGFEYATAHDEAWSLGLGWAKPSEPTNGSGLRDEYLIEGSYRVQLSPNLSLMPDVQLLLDPANAPDEDQVWVLGLRAIVTL